MNALKITTALALVLALGACNTIDRLSGIGATPELSKIKNPAESQPSVAMPMPTPIPVDRQANSLWRPGARAFFKDQRANQVGDILTVTINVADTAAISNTSSRTRESSETAGAPSLVGYGQRLFNRLPGSQTPVDPASLIELESASNATGGGRINRTETVTLRVAATVTQILPNGNLVIQGSQEMRVNYEARVLQIAGVIRREDIRSDNQVPYDRIAEARMAYGGRGQITDVNQPRWGQQIYDVIFPF